MGLLSDSDPRLRVLSSHAPPRSPAYVLYWCQAFRRPHDNLALAYAIDRANALRLPLIVYEAIRPDYPFASDRFHTFVLEGASSMGKALRERGLRHVFFLPRTPDEARGMLVRLSRQAALIVSDDNPTFIDDHNRAAARKALCPFVVVDDNTPVPLALFPKQEFAARTIRPKVHRLLPDFLKPIVEPEPTVSLARAKAVELPFAPVDWKTSDVASLVAECAIDHAVPAVTEFRGGHDVARERLDTFLRERLRSYAADHNEPSRDVTSHLSPYLHFGMISARHVALATREVARERRTPTASVDAFLEQLLVRRTLAFNFARENPAHATYDALPEWARQTLADHEPDPRLGLVSLEDLDAARSPDEVWNAAQLELRTRGVIHNYLRMLWGKLIVTWTKSPRRAHEIIVYLNDKWALDGRDPDGYTNISWCFGLHDRPWPEYAIFGKVRRMTSRSARSKLDLDGYLARAQTWRAASEELSR